MAERKIPTKDENGRDITPHIHKPITESKELTDSRLLKAAKVFLAEDIEQITGSLVEDYVKPRAESFGLDMVRKVKEFIFDSFNDLMRKLLFGGSAGSGKSYYNGQKVNYVSYNNYSSGDYYGSNGYNRNSTYSSDPRDRVKRISIPSYGEAKEVLDELRRIIKTYDKASIGDYYQAVGQPVNKIDFSYGWGRGMLDNVAIVPVRGGAYSLELPKPVAFGE